MSYLLCIETATPAYLHRQEDFVDFYCHALEEPNEQVFRKISVIAKKSGIQQRYSVLKDFSSNPEDFRFFGKDSHLEPIPGLSRRMEIYQQEALRLSTDAVRKIRGFEDVKDQITHIITVTCTGLFAPGLEIGLMKELDLKPTTHRSSINFMGCNAAVLALKQADQICKGQPDALVLIVCTELCTIHFQKDFSDDYILSNLLFADGSAAVLVGEKKQVIAEGYQPLKMNHFRSLIIHEGASDMAWRLSETGFMMNLTSYVSGLLNTNIRELFIENNMAPEQFDHWAIHPGGKKILDDFCHTLPLDPVKLASAYEVLKNYGNMSSPTVLFVLRQLLASQDIQPGESVFMAAFGPGLSIESLVLASVPVENDLLLEARTHLGINV